MLSRTHLATFLRNFGIFPVCSAKYEPNYLGCRNKFRVMVLISCDNNNIDRSKHEAILRNM